MRVTFAADHLVFRGYPFPPAQVRHTPRLNVGDVDDVDTTANPPEIRTRAGETLFVSQRDSAALGVFASTHALPNRTRFDVWGLLLEPYLDTEATAEMDRADLSRLIEAGFSADEVMSLRGRVAPALTAYNAAAWEWQHLGLYDALWALRNAFCLDTLMNRMWPGRFRAFYVEAMKVAARGRYGSG